MTLNELQELVDPDTLNAISPTKEEGPILIWAEADENSSKSIPLKDISKIEIDKYWMYIYRIYGDGMEDVCGCIDTRDETPTLIIP